MSFHVQHICFSCPIPLAKNCWTAGISSHHCFAPKGCPVRLCHNRLQGSYFEETPAISLKHAQAPYFRLGFSVFLFVWSASRKVGWTPLYKPLRRWQKHTAILGGPELPRRFTILGFCNQLFWKPWRSRPKRLPTGGLESFQFPPKLDMRLFRCCWFGSPQKRCCFEVFRCLMWRVVEDA